MKRITEKKFKKAAVIVISVLTGCGARLRFECDGKLYELRVDEIEDEGVEE